MRPRCIYSSPSAAVVKPNVASFPAGGRIPLVIPVGRFWRAMGWYFGPFMAWTVLRKQRPGQGHDQVRPYPRTRLSVPLRPAKARYGCNRIRHEHRFQFAARVCSWFLGSRV